MAEKKKTQREAKRCTDGVSSSACDRVEKISLVVEKAYGRVCESVVELREVATSLSARARQRLSHVEEANAAPEKKPAQSEAPQKAVAKKATAFSV
jgi:hypothetical protein